MGAQMVHSNNKKLPSLEQKEPGGQGGKEPTLCMSQASGWMRRWQTEVWLR